MFFKNVKHFFLLLTFLFFVSPALAQYSDLTINTTYTIEAENTLEVNDLTLDSKAILNIHGTLIVHGNLIMVNNDPQFITGSEAKVVVFGNANIANKVNINFSSYFVVVGDFTINGGGNTEININEASIYVFGAFDPGSTSLDSCDDYDNNTEDYDPAICHVGTETAFDENVDNGLIPPDIPEIINNCTTPEIDNPGNQTSCGSFVLPLITGTNLSGNEAYYTGSGGTGISYDPGDQITGTMVLFIFDENGACSDEETFEVTINPIPAATISGDAIICEGGSAIITVDLTGTPGWSLTFQLDGSNYLTVINIPESPYTFNVTQPGVYTVGIVSDANCTGTASGSATVTVNEFNMVVSDITPEPSGNHCPEFLPPFNASSTSYNPGVTEVVFKVEKNLSSSTGWTFDFAVDETGDVEVYDLAIVGNNSAISYAGDNAGGSIDADNNTEVTFTFQVWNVPGTALDVDFSVSNGDDGNCDETGILTDNNINHLINAMPDLGTIE